MLSFKLIRNLSLAAMAFIIVLIGIISFVSTDKITGNFSEVILKSRPVSDKVNLIKMNFLRAKDIFNNFVKLGQGNISEAVSILDSTIKECNALRGMVDKEYHGLVDSFLVNAKRFRVAVLYYLEEFDYDPTGDTTIQMEEVVSVTVKKTEAVLMRMLNDIGAKMRAAEIDMFIVAKVNQRVVGMVMFFGIFTGLLLAFFMTRALALPISTLVNGTRKVSRGELSFKVNVESNDELGQLAAAFNKMTRDLDKSMAREKKLTIEAAALAESEHRKAEELRLAYQRLREMQDMLVQAEKLNAVGRLASGVAHEVRNPLGIITQGIASLEKNPEFKKGDLKETLSMVKDSVDRADRIVTLLLDFSRASKVDLHPEDISSILTDSLNLTRSKLEQVEIINQIQKDLPLVFVDRRRLEQVFVNLFINAAQAIPAAGKITIRAYEKRLEKKRDGIGSRNEDKFRIGEKALVVEIEDNGTGISQQNLKKVFDPFFTTKGPKGGTGLGLSVSRSLISMHKGLMEIESEPGKGTKVRVILKITEG